LESRAVHDPSSAGSALVGHEAPAPWWAVPTSLRVLSTCNSSDPVPEGSPWGKTTPLFLLQSCEDPRLARAILQRSHVGSRCLRLNTVVARLCSLFSASLPVSCGRGAIPGRTSCGANQGTWTLHGPNSSKPFFSPWPEPVERGFSYVTDETNITGGGATSGTGRCELTGPAAVAPDPVMLGLRSRRAW